MTALVIGTAVSGRAAASLLRSLGDKVIVYDADPAAIEGVDADEVHGGPWKPSLLDGIDLVITSPGVPEHAPPVRDSLASGLPIWSELELGFRHLRCPVVAVTATNGKTTVTELAARMLRSSGLDAAAAGNIGDPLCGAVGHDWDVVVVEASSFQLRFVDTFHADAAVLLNVAPDHLDWHGSFDAYAAAKARILERQTPDDVVIYDADDEGASTLVAGARSQRVPVSGRARPDGGWGPEGGALVIAGLEIPLEQIPRRDPVMLVDVAAAAQAALHVGATPGGVLSAVTEFTSGPHRRQFIGTWNGVAWVDDSKATNPHAALAAIRDHGPVVLIAGGRNKGLDVGGLPLEPNVRQVFAIGEAAAELAATGGPVTIVATLEEAVAAADHASRPGDTVLLAPGCASFDMFRSYADRGERFAAAVLARKRA
ncbi:MAG: UDP-N-acetylmuramoyl-L-alanine--D-glutamate ligase [Acidimicrobiia bacterium]